MCDVGHSGGAPVLAHCQQLSPRSHAHRDCQRRKTQPLADRRDERKETAAQCLALAHSTTEPHTRAALLTMAQKLYDQARKRAHDYEAAQREFNDPADAAATGSRTSSRSSRRKTDSSANY